MKIELFTFCDFAQDNNGKLGIMGTFDTIFARTFPCIHPQLSVVIRLRFDLWEFTEHTFRIETQSVNSTMNINPITGTIDVKDAGNTTAVSHLVFTISNICFSKHGVANFVLYVDDKELSSIPLYVRHSEH